MTKSKADSLIRDLGLDRQDVRELLHRMHKLVDEAEGTSKQRIEITTSNGTSVEMGEIDGNVE